MKKLCYSLIALLVVVGLMASVAGAAEQSALQKIQDKGVLRVATAPGYFPFEMIGPNGEIIGFDVDIAKAIADALEVELKVIPFEWSGIIPALVTNKADLIIAGMTITPQRALKVTFTDPYYQTGQALLVNKKHKGVDSWADLDKEGMRIGACLGQTGHFAAEKFFKHAEVVKFEGSENLALAVATGKVDAAVYDQPWVLIRAKKHPSAMFAIPEPQTVENLGIALPYNDLEFKTWLDVFLMDFLNSPQYDELIQYWFIDMPWMEE